MAVQYTLFADAAAVALAPFNSFLTRGQQIAQDLQILVVLGLSIYIFYQGAVAMQGQNQKHPLLKVFSASAKVVACMGFASYLGYHYSVGESIVIEFQSFFAQLFRSSNQTVTQYQGRLGKLPDITRPETARLQPAFRVYREARRRSGSIVVTIVTSPPPRQRSA